MTTNEEREHHLRSSCMEIFYTHSFFMMLAADAGQNQLQY
jgi:hypothetical protein